MIGFLVALDAVLFVVWVGIMVIVVRLLLHMQRWR